MKKKHSWRRLGRSLLTLALALCLVTAELAPALAVTQADIDKLKESGLTAAMVDGCTTFEEAAYTIVCKKMYAQELPPENCTDMPIFDKAYEGTDDYHKMYIGQIVAAYVND